MRREGYELQIGQPQVIIKNIDGVKHEPIEELTIDIPENLSGKAIEMVTIRKGEMTIMEPKGDLIFRVHYTIKRNYRFKKLSSYCNFWKANYISQI